MPTLNAFTVCVLPAPAQVNKAPISSYEVFVIDAAVPVSPLVMRLLEPEQPEGEVAEGTSHDALLKASELIHAGAVDGQGQGACDCQIGTDGQETCSCVTSK